MSVLEIIPPAVNTDLGGAGLHTFGENLDAFSDHVIAKMEESDDNTGYQQEADIWILPFQNTLYLFHFSHTEIGYKMSENVRLATVEQKASAFEAMNKHFH